ncbi:MAG: lysoplasmalogenase [Bacteroidia bacterium]|nr:lysoplasmalogenase [Bacteroidia bacterium]
MKRETIFFLVFLIVSAGELIAVFTSNHQLNLVCKPLILLSLIGYYLASVEVRSFVFIRALFFSWAGDVLLLLTVRSEIFFITGLIAFLISHILFIQVYRQHRDSNVEKELLGPQKIRFALPIVLAGTGLIAILYNSLGPLKIPVMVYSIVLCVMVLTALFRYGRTSSQSFWMVIAGALLFMGSDSLLAINKFLNPIEGAGFFIMATYISAQYLIVEGILQHSKK